MSLLGGGGGGGGGQGGAALGGLAGANPYAALIAAAAKIASNHEQKKHKIWKRWAFGDGEHEAAKDRINLAAADAKAAQWGVPTNYAGMAVPYHDPVNQPRNLDGLMALFAGLGAMAASQGGPQKSALEEVDAAIKSLPGGELPDLGSKRANDLALLGDLETGSSRSKGFQLEMPSLLRRSAEDDDPLKGFLR